MEKLICVKIIKSYQQGPQIGSQKKVCILFVVIVSTRIVGRAEWRLIHLVLSISEISKIIFETTFYEYLVHSILQPTKKTYFGRNDIVNQRCCCICCNCFLRIDFRAFSRSIRSFSSESVTASES